MTMPAVQQQFIVPQHQPYHHQYQPHQQHQQLVSAPIPQPPQPAYNALFQYPYGIPNAPGSELAALGFQQHHYSRLATEYPSGQPVPTTMTLQPPAPIFSTSNIRMSSFEAYAKNDSSGCTSGVIAGLSAKPEVTQTRKRISPEQTAILEEAFQRIPKADKAYRDELALRTGLPTRTIQIWFQNRRAKAKQKKEPGFVKTEPTKIQGSPEPSKKEDEETVPEKIISPTGTKRSQQTTTPQLASGGAFKGQSTLNPPPHPTQRAHNGKQQQMLHDAFLQAPSSSSGKITSQVIHVPTTVGHRSGGIGQSPLISQSPQFRLSAVPTPISATGMTPFPHSASSSHSFMDLRSATSSSASSTGGKKMKRSFSNECEPPIGTAGFVRGSNNTTGSYVSPSGPNFDIVEGPPEGPVVLTPMSSLQSPNVSPYCGSATSSGSGREKRTPVTAATSVFPEPIGFGSAKRRRPNQFMTPLIRSDRSFDSPVVTEADFSAVLTSPTLQISPSSSHHDLSPGVQNQSPTGAVTPAETLAAAAQLRRSLSASGLNMFHSRRQLRQRSVADPYRHGSISGSTPSVVASSTLSSMETLKDLDARYVFEDFTFNGKKNGAAEDNVSPRDEIKEEPVYGTAEENEFDMLIGAYENRAAPVTTDSFEWM
ncbi:hypothetical protein TRVA0_008S03268 [Trichomonascus vanleenenianus]|uniref:homeobox domain-containing protein n=1 Tax=Trichomonascus vanleenenianus TaxID=2268995 RepID=UPI003ECADF78